MYKKLVPLAGAAALICVASNAHASAGCSAIGSGTYNATSTDPHLAVSNPAVSGAGFAAGDVITATIPTGTQNSVAIGDVTASTFVAGTIGSTLYVTYTVPAATAHTLGISVSSLLGGVAVTYSCVSAAAAAATPGSTISQTVQNAQAALFNGAQTLQSYSDWVSKAVMGSFGLTRNGGAKAARAALQTAPTAQAKLERLRAEERELSEELAEHKDGDAALAAQLQATRTDLKYASLAVALDSRSTVAALPRSQDARLGASVPADTDAGGLSTQTADGPIGGAKVVTQPPPAVSLGAKDLNDFCDDACDVLGNRWNVWLEGRVVGAVDSLAATNALGFVGSTGIDYKLRPWLTLGLSAGTETFETKFGTQGIRTGTLGFTALPYVGVRLTDNVFGSAFAGLSTIAYNTNPLPGVSARFNALRFLFGGTLTGVWRDGPWRFQPTLSGAYGNETQNGYTDSAGTPVPSQVLTYGRIGAGPEVGYTFRPTGMSWSVEPFVLLKGNLDFASSNASVLNGQSVVLRPGTLGSGSTGLGANVNFDNGLFVRAQGSYDSIGVWGLNVWSGLIHAGMTF